MANSIEIFGDFDGGNPKDPGSIIQTGPKAFTIIPFSEDNDPNYKFRLDVKVINCSAETQTIALTIDWQEPRFNYLRNFVYSKNERDSDWTFLPMSASTERTLGEIELPPGETYVCLHPKYTYEDYLNFIRSIPKTEFLSKEKFGMSPENRELWLVKITGSTAKLKKKIMIVSRIHPYETSGSFCAEGIVNHFLNHHLPFTSYNSHIEVFLIPMANPDGVFNGLCKLTSLDGIDLSKRISDSDSTSRLLKEVIDEIKPHVYCEFHNWMFSEFDGIYFLNRMLAKRFIKNMPSQRNFKKAWKIHLNKKMFSVPPLGLKKYCRERYNSISFVLEYPWHCRNIDDMKKLGADTIRTLAEI